MTSQPNPFESAAESFEPLRPKLVRVAYRMLGSVAEAEDVVQDAFLRWADVDRGVVREPEAYLRTLVTRLCLDVLKSARHRRETYVGPWLPEPLVEDQSDDMGDVTLPLMLALERLSPLERVAIHADGGGKRPAALQPIVGIDPVMDLYAGLAQLFAQRASTLVRYALINGLPGFVTLEADGLLQTTALDIVDGKIAAVYTVRNPDKLRHLEDRSVH